MLENQKCFLTTRDGDVVVEFVQIASVDKVRDFGRVTYRGLSVVVLKDGVLKQVDLDQVRFEEFGINVNVGFDPFDPQLTMNLEKIE